MPNFDSLKLNPYFLTDKQVEWVKNTVAGMTQEEKIGQLFCFIYYGGSEDELKNVTEKYKAGGIMGRPMPAQDVLHMVAQLQQNSKIPMLIAANFEAGGNGLVAEGTNVGPCVQVGATGDPGMAGKQGYVCGREGAAVGANWSFAPVIDILKNYQNPIVPTRAFGQDENLVADCGVAYTKACQEQGVAVSIKHFPGDGIDGRDQHLVTSINSLSCEEWDDTFGKAYKASIDAGALTVMAGHIAMPEYSRKLRPGIKDEDIMPATLAPELMNDLLRGQLGFNGMVVTDASTMAGMCIPMPREQLVPFTIAAGCDMFLFTRNSDEDYGYMKKGVENGVISPERLDEAVMRILGVKQALKLVEKKENGTLIPALADAMKVVGCAEHKEIEVDCADRAVTLVKNLDNVLPISPGKHKRVLLYPITVGPGALSQPVDVGGIMKEALEKEGFEVDIFKPMGKGLEGFTVSASSVIDNYDLLLYACNLTTKSNQTTVRIEWEQPMGANCPIYITSLPTIFVSFANPFHLQDVPRIRTFINAYSFKDVTIKAVIDKLLGRSEFKGKDPVDSFCGMWDTHL